MIRKLLPLLTASVTAVLAALGCGAGSRAAASGAVPRTPPPTAPPARILQVSFLDVGQGDAALIQAPGKVNVLIDGGPTEAGDRVVQIMKRAGVKKLNWVIASHPHADHIGGLTRVLRVFQVGKALDPGYNHGTSIQAVYLGLLKHKGVQAHLARAGDRYTLGPGLRLEVLAPEAPLTSGSASDANNNSIVLRLVFGKTSFLFTGDMQEEERSRLLTSHAEAELHSQVLKVAHHGSRNGTNSELLDAVQPRYAVISCGRGNDYGHPHPAALTALRAAGCRVLRTDQIGTVVFRSDGKTLKLLPQPGLKPVFRPTTKGHVIENRITESSPARTAARFRLKTGG